MIDCHIHAVPPNLPGVGSLAGTLRMPPASVAQVLRQQMQQSGTTVALAMGAWNVGESDPLGIDHTLAIAEMVPGLKAIGIMDPTRTDDAHFARVEGRLAAGKVVALKGYLGYLHFEPAHANYRRYYDLAAKHKVPVMFHTGDTYSAKAKLKFAHPLGVDEVAVDHPDTRFLLCHIGNPWVTDAAEVIYKNLNVWADLSGLVVGDETAFTSEAGMERIAELHHEIRRIISYSERPNRFLYGTDWPLAPMPAYRDFVRDALPADLHDMVFEENAKVLFRLT